MFVVFVVFVVFFADLTTLTTLTTLHHQCHLQPQSNGHVRFKLNLHRVGALVDQHNHVGLFVAHCTISKMHALFQLPRRFFGETSSVWMAIHHKEGHHPP